METFIRFPFGSLCLPFGSLLAPFWIPFGSLLVPFGCFFQYLNSLGSLLSPYYPFWLVFVTCLYLLANFRPFFFFPKTKRSHKLPAYPRASYSTGPSRMQTSFPRPGAGILPQATEIELKSRKKTVLILFWHQISASIFGYRFFRYCSDFGWILAPILDAFWHHVPYFLHAFFLHRFCIDFCWFLIDF